MTRKKKGDLHIRWMIRRDMPIVLDIEWHSYEWPWSEDEFLSHLRQRNIIGMVAEASEEIIGFMVYELHLKKLVLLNIAVHPKHRRSGVGRRMINKLLAKLSLPRRRHLSVQVRESNLPAQQFFRACGLRAVHIVRDSYIDTPEDVYIMARSIDDPDIGLETHEHTEVM